MRARFVRTSEPHWRDFGGIEHRVDDRDEHSGLGDDVPSFLTDRICFLRERLDDAQSESAPAGVGTIESIRERTDDVVEEIMSADDGECPHCGLVLAESGPPMCPRCGAPR